MKPESMPNTITRLIRGKKKSAYNVRFYDDLTIRLTQESIANIINRY